MWKAILAALLILLATKAARGKTASVIDVAIGRPVAVTEVATNAE